MNGTSTPVVTVNATRPLRFIAGSRAATAPVKNGGRSRGLRPPCRARRARCVSATTAMQVQSVVMAARFDLAVIGSGPAGQKGAICAAKHRKKVVVIDREEHVGGVSVH